MSAHVIRTMQCADEEGFSRTFVVASFDENGEPCDWSCSTCGWMQTSYESGCAELALCATWHNVAEYEATALVARSGGYDVPSEPEHLEV